MIVQIMRFLGLWAQRVSSGMAVRIRVPASAPAGAPAMSDDSQLLVEFECLRQAYWAAIRECARLEESLRRNPSDPLLRPQLEAAERQRVVARNALQKYRDRTGL